MRAANLLNGDTKEIIEGFVVLKAVLPLLLLLLCACGAPVSRPMPLAESGPVAVNLRDQAYIADLQPVQGGATLAMTRDGVAFGNADGLEAKRAAEAFCATRNARVSPQSYGHFSAGVWLFQGGCA